MNVGYFNLQNTRISKYRDILNSTLGIDNPLEHAIGGLASLMPTIDISTQRSSGGIGNAWDFWDFQRVWSAADRWSFVSAAHTVKTGVEYRRINLEGEFMARTNGDLDYDNWVLFFTGHGASGGGSDLDQGDTRRDFLAHDIGAFIQDDWRVGGGLTLNAGLRYDLFGNFTERTGRIGNYYLPEAAATLGAEPGFQVPGNAPFFQPGFTPLAIGLVVAPGTSIDLSQIHAAKDASTIRSDYNNVAPRVGFAWQPRFAQKLVVRGGWGVYYERTGASYKRDLQLSAPFFFYQNVPSPPNMADPYPRLNVNPFQIPLNVQIARDANGARQVGARRRHGVSGLGAVQRQEQHVHRSPAAHALPAAVDGKRAVRPAPGPAAGPGLRRIARGRPPGQGQSCSAGRSAGSRRSTASPTSTIGSAV